MLLEIHVEEGIEVKVEVIRKTAVLVQKPEAQPLVKQEILPVGPAALSDQVAPEPKASTLEHTGVCSQHNSKETKPLLLFVSGHVPSPAADAPSMLTAGAYINNGSHSFELSSNILSTTLAYSKEVAELGAVYSALASPQLEAVMKHNRLLHVLCDAQRNITLLRSASIGSYQFDAAVAAHVRRLAAAAPYKIKFVHVSSSPRKGRAAGIKKARTLAEQCTKHEVVCDLRQVARLGMGC